MKATPNHEPKKIKVGKEKYRTIDWLAIKLDYMKGDLTNPNLPPTFQSLSNIHGVARQAIGKKAKQEDWQGERLRARKAIADKTAEQIQLKEFKGIADSLSSISQHMDETEETLGKMLKAKTKERTIQTKTGTDTITEKLNPQDYKAIIATLRDIAKSKRELIDKASIDALRYDHRTAMTNFAQSVAEIIKEEISDPTVLQRIFEKIIEATRPRTPEEIRA